MTLFERVFNGNDAVYGLTEQAIDAAIAQHGEEKAVSFPNTAYCLPCYYAVTGVKVTNLKELKEALGVVKTLMTREPRLNDAFMSGVATALCAEFIEALKYIDGATPYEEPLYGHLADAVIRELGVPLVTGDIPGVAVILGSAPTVEEGVALVKSYQAQGILVTLVGGICDQVAEAGMATGANVRVIPLGKDVTSVIHVVSVALRAALIFGNVTPGDSKTLMEYTMQRVPAFVNAFAPLDDVIVACGAGAIALGFPVITNETENIARVPKSLIVQENVSKFNATSLEARDIKIKITNIDIPVAFASAFEGEIIRRGDMQVEFDGSRVDCAELVHTVDASEIEDHKITVVGPEVDDMELGSKNSIAYVDSIFDVDTLCALRNKVCEVAGKTYGVHHDDDVSIRLITDHMRSATFLISDGVMPTNEGRGYVLRRLIRRAARHGRLLGIEGPFLEKLSETVIEGSKDGYPELEEKKTFILNVLHNEESQFNKTIDQGLKILADLEAEMKEAGKSVLGGSDAFRLYDTYGFPIDLTKEILEEKGYTIDEDGFKEEMEVQRKRARESRAVSNYMGADATVYDEIDRNITTEFDGYDKLEATSKVTVLTTETEIVDSLMEGQKGTIFVEKTPFYATMGGQEGDTGVITTANGVFRVEDTIKLRGGKYGHVGVMESGMISNGDEVTLKVDEQERKDTCKNHSATHLLQKALKTVLGAHVEQKGSLVNPTRLRFDFAHFQAMTPEEIAETEALVNKEIQAALPVTTRIMGIEEAKKTGAMALFGEKYGDEVRVVSMGDFSVELCGGTHVANTANITLFKIVSEAGVAAGVRRIEALTGNNVIEYYRQMEENLHTIAKTLKTSPAEITEKITHLQKEVKELQSENESLKSKMAQDSLGNVMDQVVEVKGVKVLASAVDGVDMNGLRDLGDQLKEKLGEGVVVLASAKDGKVSLLAMATQGAMDKGAHAGNLIKAAAAIVGGGGGGRPNMAQAGGKNPDKIPEAIAKVAELVEGQLK